MSVDSEISRIKECITRGNLSQKVLNFIFTNKSVQKVCFGSLAIWLHISLIFGPDMINNSQVDGYGQIWFPLLGPGLVDNPETIHCMFLKPVDVKAIRTQGTLCQIEDNSIGKGFLINRGWVSAFSSTHWSSHVCTGASCCDCRPTKGSVRAETLRMMT